MRCRACNVEIDVNWRRPKDSDGSFMAPILEDLCVKCRSPVCLDEYNDFVETFPDVYEIIVDGLREYRSSHDEDE